MSCLIVTLDLRCHSKHFSVGLVSKSRQGLGWSLWSNIPTPIWPSIKNFKKRKIINRGKYRSATGYFFIILISRKKIIFTEKLINDDIIHFWCKQKFREMNNSWRVKKKSNNLNRFYSLKAYFLYLPINVFPIPS